MKPLSISLSSIVIFGAITSSSLGFGSHTQGSSDKVELSVLGSLVRNNARGDYKYPGVFKFTRIGSRSYVNHFARKMAKNDGEIATYEDVINQGIRVWEEQEGPKGYTNDLAGGLAFYTMTNVALGTNKPYEDMYLGNMVAQFRKAFCAKAVATMSAAKKQNLYDYMIAESVYMQALASAGQERNQADSAEFLTKMGMTQVRNTFNFDASQMTINESGVHFN